MSDLKDKAKKHLDNASDAVKKTSDKAVDKAKDVAHAVGKSVEKGGKQLRNV